MARFLVVVAFIVGSVAGFAADLRLFMVDDTCPQWEDEGTMAAERSPYSLLMCGPGTEPPFVWAVYAGAGIALALALLLLVRPPSRRLLAGALALAVLAIPTATVGLLHVTLPRDCVPSDPGTPGCVRDRELR